MTNEYLNEIERKLTKVESLENRRNALSGLSLFLIVVSISFVLVCILESLFGFSSIVRTVFFYGLIFSIVAQLTYFVFVSLVRSFFLFSKPDLRSASEKVGRSFDEIKDELLNAIEILTQNSRGYSTELINEAFRRIYIKTKAIDFNKSIDFSESIKKLKIGLAAIIVSVLLILIVPVFSASAMRLINYSKDFTPPQKFTLNVQPGNKEITKGEVITIIVTASGEIPSLISLLTKREDQTEFDEAALKPDSSGNFRYRIADIKNSFVYFASAEGIESEQFKISVINRPVITQLEVTVVPPAYSKLPNVVQRDNGNISALHGSTVLINVLSSRKLSDASISFNDGTMPKMPVNDISASYKFSVKNSLNYFINIIDERGISSIHPVTYSIHRIDDSNPSIEVINPKENIRLGTDGKISIAAKIADDYGLTSLTLNYRLTASKYRASDQDNTQISIPIKKESIEDEIYYVWDLVPLYLAEGESLAFYLEVTDNDIVSGPKSTRSQTFSVFVPSLDELYNLADNQHREAAEELKETLKDAEKLSAELKKISNDLKQNSKEINWQEKERIEQASKKFSDLMQKTEEAAKKLDAMQRELLQNNLLSEETLQKYNELQNLLEQLNSEELMNAFKRMQEAMQNMLRDNVQISLEDLKANEEYFRKSLERTLNLLRRIQVEMKIDELIKRIDDVSHKVEDLLSKTEQTNLNDKNKHGELLLRQDDLLKDIADMKEEMETLNEKMSELTDMPEGEMEKLLEEFEKQNNEELSEEILNDLKRFQKMEAIKSQKQLAQNMKQTKSNIQNLQSALQQISQMKTFYEMMKILDDLLTLSRMQENLKNSTNNLSPQSSGLNKNSREQSELQNNLSRVLQKMSALSQKTFAITPEMGRSLGKAYSEMQQSITWMQNGNPAYSSQRQTEAMRNLNEAANLIKGGMEQMMSGGQGGGMMGLMQQLQQLSRQQMDLNKLTQMLSQGRMTQEMMAQIKRIAQQQEIIRKSLDQLNRESKEAGQSKRLASNLEKILGEMNEVVSNLQSQKLNEDIVRQQERILSKLLEAQRSINERDFENERISKTGIEFVRSSPPELILYTEEGKNKIRDELLKAIREGYKRDYEEIIRNYFHSIGKEKNKYK
jgi:hypothetical protein